MFRFKQIAGIALNVAIFAALLFIPAGTLHWPRGWVFMAVSFVAGALSTFAISEDLLDERYRLLRQRGQPLADRIVLIPLLVSFVGMTVLIPLDVFRLHLLAPPGPVVSALGLVLFVVGWGLMAYAMRENAYAAPVVKLQQFRGQHVIDTGPYRIVRHPMYAGAVPFMIGMPLWLGSYSAAIASAVPLALLAIRISIEEALLRRELPGYEEYTHRTRFRLVPHVW
jgi:protein-S-isoprenylcysteine O-methyltransferase Ste14